MDIVWYRISSWTTYAYFSFVCMLFGHIYGQHFTEMFKWADDEQETPWCTRCGREKK